MSHNRQISEPDKERLLIRTLGLKLSNGHVVDGHAHSWGQIIFATRGVMQVDAEGSRWAVPPMRCLWVPVGITHNIRIIAETWMRTIYLRPSLTVRLPDTCKILNVSRLLRELILEIVRLKMLSGNTPSQSNLAGVLIDQLAAADEMDLKITMPADPRAVRLANIISDDPANKAPLSDLAKLAASSPRTLERLFVQETGLTIGRWRQQSRLMMAIRHLADGSQVSQAAFESGYESASSFIAMFRREIGISPGQYVRNLKS